MDNKLQGILINQSFILGKHQALYDRRTGMLLIPEWRYNYIKTHNIVDIEDILDYAEVLFILKESAMDCVYEKSKMLDSFGDVI